MIVAITCVFTVISILPNNAPTVGWTKPAQLMICPCCRLSLHDGEHVGTICRAEGFTADASAEGE